MKAIILISLATLLTFSNCLVPILNPSFDVRENGFLMNKPKSTLDYILDNVKENCNTNLHLQISSILADKLNIKADFSPMNSITCSGGFCRKVYLNKEDIVTDFNQIIDFYNTKGGQLLPNYPYSFDTKTGSFVECKEFMNEIDYFTAKKQVKITALTNDFEILKSEIFKTGPILAFFNAPKTFFSGYKAGGIYVPDNKEKVGYYALRIVGWRSLGDKKYWVFGFTVDKSWGIFNFGMMEVGVELEFYNLEFEK